jgi:YggT family protein
MIIAEIIGFLINLYIFVIVAHVAVTWLVAFKVLDLNNEQARNLVEMLKRATDPIMKPIQKYVPPLGGIDISPIVAIIGLQILARIVWKLCLILFY